MGGKFVSPAYLIIFCYLCLIFIVTYNSWTWNLYWISLSCSIQHWYNWSLWKIKEKYERIFGQRKLLFFGRDPWLYVSPGQIQSCNYFENHYCYFSGSSVNLILFCRVLSHVFGIHSWSLLLLKATFTSCIGIVALQLYLTLTNGKQNRT